MRGHPQRRILSPGSLPKLPLPYLVWLILAAAVFTCVVEFEAHGQAQAELLSPPQQRGTAPEHPAKPVATSPASTSDRLGDHYLMLVNTAIANKMDEAKFAQFDRSPYDGMAVSFSDAYDTSPPPSVAQMESQIAGWKKSTAKDIWPWVYLNRMIGVNNAEGNQSTKSPYFQRFEGLDLDGKAGAQNDFLEN
jgi:hypothetical protein